METTAIAASPKILQGKNNVTMNIANVPSAAAERAVSAINLV